MGRSLRYTGVAAVITIWTTLLAATAASGFDLLGAEPISYLGSDSRSAALFTVGLVGAALLLTAFHRFVRGRYPVSAGFSLAMLAGLAGQMVAAFAPIGGDPVVHRIHTTSALALGISLPLLMWRFAAGQRLGPWRTLAYRLFWAEAMACAVGLYLSARMVAPVAEILPGSVFHAWVVAVTFGAVTLAREEGDSRATRLVDPDREALQTGALAVRDPGDAVLLAVGPGSTPPPVRSGRGRPGRPDRGAVGPAPGAEPRRR